MLYNKEKYFSNATSKKYSNLYKYYIIDKGLELLKSIEHYS
jgi:hypothetical protein